MVSGISNGFILPKIQGITISSDDREKYGISLDDWRKVDKDGDWLITADEFLSSGMSISSIFNAYKMLAKSNNAYVSPSEEANMNPNMKANGPANMQGNMFANNPNKQYGQNPYGSYNLMHPNVKGSGLGNIHDFMA